MSNGKIIVLVTVPDIETGRKIARVLLENRKAACVNILPLVNSLFWWQNKIDDADESLLIIKTKSVLLAELIELVKQNHSYEVPEIIAMPIVGGNTDYLQWIDNVLV